MKKNLEPNKGKNEGNIVPTAYERPIGKHTAKQSFYFLALLSGILASFTVFTDVAAMTIAMPKEPIAYGILTQWAGLIISIVIVLIATLPSFKEPGKPLGYHLDPNFDRPHIFSWQIMKPIIIAGFFGGINTLFYYHLSSQNDSSLVLPYSQFVVIYLMFADLMNEHDYPSAVEIQSILSITFGVILVGSSKGALDLFDLLIVLGPLNVTSAIYVIFLSKASRMKIKPKQNVDTLNLRIWTLFFMNLFMTVFSIPLLNDHVISVIVDKIWITLPYSLIGMAFIFFSIIAYTRALSKGKMSVVSSLSSISTVMGIPLTAIASLAAPQIFGVLSTDTLSWTLKIIGTIFVLSGIILLSVSEVRAIILVRSKTGSGDLLEKIGRIYGVESVAAVASQHDYIVRIKVRSIGKAENLIIKQIEKIEGIESIYTLITIREFI